jgi:hypothetical protein
MISFIEKKKSNLMYRILCGFISFAFLFSIVVPPGTAQVVSNTVLGLPVPGTMVNLSNAHVPFLIQGMTVYYDNPFQFDFILDTGSDNVTSHDQIKEESRKLIKYFLASLTIPEDDLWVNLSPTADLRHEYKRVHAGYY